uniref:Large ribosomal subunit protein uL18 n=1 Tax=Hirondellea gigas TaxID=1518452 RepID=A0A6A7G8L0_9CRUS
MGFLKVQKTAQYFSNYQPKRRRRREGKTDYKCRRTLLTQDFNKYGTPKYRLVVRRTNRRMIAQIVFSTLEGDRTIAAADSFELKNYGISVGIKNFAGAYCVGLLVARRLLTSVGLADQFIGVLEPTGTKFHIENEEDCDKRPFKAILDIGLFRSTKGNRLFAVLKGATDGGLHVPHCPTCYPGEDDEDGIEMHIDRILGKHILEYHEFLTEEGGEDAVKDKFGSYVKNGILGPKIQEMYKTAHAAIRADPRRKPKDTVAIKEACKNKYPSRKLLRLTPEVRKQRVRAKIEALRVFEIEKAEVAAVLLKEKLEAKEAQKEKEKDEQEAISKAAEALDA